MRHSAVTFGPCSDSVLNSARFGKKSKRAPAKDDRKNSYRGGFTMPKKNSPEWRQMQNDRFERKKEMTEAKKTN